MEKKDAFAVQTPIVSLPLLEERSAVIGQHGVRGRTAPPHRGEERCMKGLRWKCSSIHLRQVHVRTGEIIIHKKKKKNL